MSNLIIKDLDVSVAEKPILNGVNLSINSGELHILMGPNGSGKSTLANTIFGNPKYSVNSGSLNLDGEEILKLKTDERAKKGLFLAFQEPVEISGVNIMNFLRIAFSQLRPEDQQIKNLRQTVTEYMGKFGLSDTFLKRSLNEGFSGGEKKRFELLQSILFKPKIAVLDELDSGLDIDSIKILVSAIKTQLENGSGILMITHNDKILDYLKPNFVHVMIGGKILKSGGLEIAEEIRKKGYSGLSR